MTALIIEMPKGVQRESTEELRRLWDEWDPAETMYCGQYWHEDVYFELLRRGEEAPL